MSFTIASFKGRNKLEIHKFEFLYYFLLQANRICPSTGEAVRPLDKPSPRQDRRVENNGEHFEILTSQSRPYIDDHRTTSSYSSTGEAIHLQKLPRKPTYTREDASESKKWVGQIWMLQFYMKSH